MGCQRHVTNENPFELDVKMTIESTPVIPTAKKLEGDVWVALRSDPTRMKRVNNGYKLLEPEVWIEFGPDIKVGL